MTDGTQRDAAQSDQGLLKCRPFGEERLLAQGFQPRFVADRRMVIDSTATYEELGYEVTTLPLEEDGVGSDCAGCALVTGNFAVLYTRRS